MSLKRKEFYTSPIQGFLVMDIDEKGDTKYYSYENMFDCWFIMKVTSTNVSYHFSAIKDDYDWSNRTSLTYGSPSEIFKFY